jgi:GrpB-like predicted nucleotidyltransferase (UPF0157 family)
MVSTTATPARAPATDSHPSLGDRFDPAIRIVEYDPEWPALAVAELRRIGQALGEIAVRLEHVGSTAVPGLAAKPILDLQVSVEAIEPRDRYVYALERLGYLFVPDADYPDYRLFAKPPARPRTHHVHVCEAGSQHELRHVVVRDFLSVHGEEARRYAALKRELAAGHPRDRLAYIAGKREYMTALERRALEWTRGHSVRSASEDLSDAVEAVPLEDRPV